MYPTHSRPLPTAPHLPAPGFADPVHDAQRCFRLVLKALSYPGRIQDLRGLLSIAPEPLFPATAALCLTLMDVDTSVWLGRDMDTPDARQFLSFHCGCPIAARPGEAAFALLSTADAADLDAFCVGTPEYPDRAATLLIQTSSIREGAAAGFSGPGVADRQDVAIDGIDAEFWRKRALVNGAFPTGLDIIFADPSHIVGLPRTTIARASDPARG